MNHACVKLRLTSATIVFHALLASACVPQHLKPQALLGSCLKPADPPARAGWLHVDCPSGSWNVRHGSGVRSPDMGNPSLDLVSCPTSAERRAAATYITQSQRAKAEQQS